LPNAPLLKQSSSNTPKTFLCGALRQYLALDFFPKNKGLPNAPYLTTKKNVWQKLHEFLTKIVPEKAQKINPLISLPVNVYNLAEMIANHNILPPGN